jgi:hypothetical protein
MVKEAWGKLGAALSDPEAYEYVSEKTYLSERPLRLDNPH